MLRALMLYFSHLAIFLGVFVCVEHKSNAESYEVLPFSLNYLSLVEGTIETDGTRGMLTASNITHYSITITDEIGLVTLEDSTSEIFGTIVATGTEIFIPVPAAGGFSNLNLPPHGLNETSVIWQVDNEFNLNSHLLRMDYAVDYLRTQPAQLLLIAIKVPEPTTIQFAIISAVLFATVAKKWDR